MKNEKIIVYKKIAKDLIEKLESNGFNVVQFDGVNDSNREEFLREISDAIGTVGSNTKFDEAVLTSARKLQVCSTISVGYDAFNVPELNKRGIALMHTAECESLTETMGDTMMALVLASARKIVNVSERIKNGEWKSTHLDHSWYGVDVNRKTMGIVGMGRIGEVLAKRARLGFDMNILYNSRSQHESVESKYQAKKVDLETLLTQSDFICAILPHSKETHHFFSDKEFSMMKKSAIFINGGRGPVVDELALIRALENNTILGAGLDVFEKEPIDLNNPLLKMSNVTAVPHIGTSVIDTHYQMALVAIENLIQALGNNFEKNCVNKTVMQQIKKN